MNQTKGNNDPFMKVNLKAKNIIENAEKNRNNTAERRTGSTGGSSNTQMEMQHNLMNQTAINFYSPKKINSEPNPASPNQAAPN